jgi:hypothetical protein
MKSKEDDPIIPLSLLPSIFQKKNEILTNYSRQRF